ncbi:MAG: ATP-dependent DNA helicase [Acidobacteriota bacterium]|nr:ATP-dependent DNA helicase [Acidobacteriota bacterium]MDH3529806.1 ATP-dependent DNA helicase [Acidobacteriota bacterium]
MEKIFGPGGLLAKHHENYEYRAGQVEMADAVLKAFEDKRHLIVEAGTGTGKTLAYLVPTVAAALARDQRVIISTGTKNLQEQLMEKDIPFLQEILPRKFKAAYMKGRSNYACLYKIDKAADQPILEGLDEMDYFEEIRLWSKETDTGDRGELTHLPERLPFWSRINAKSESCIGQKCPEFERCFITRMREKAEDADIIVVNHHLYFADLNVRGNDYGKVVPDYGSVVFDEAHQLEDIAADYFGFQVSSYQLDELARDAHELPIPDAVAVSGITRAIARITGFSDIFWSRFRHGRGKDGRFPVAKSEFVGESGGESQPTSLGEAYYHLDEGLERLEKAVLGFAEDIPEVESVVRRIRQVRFNLEFVVLQSEENYVYWLERRGRGIYLRASPIDVSGILRERLFENIETAVLTSATLSSGGSFDFIQSRLGIENAETLLAPTSFDFSAQSLIYLPVRMPEPRSPEFAGMAAEEIVKLLEITGGRAFVLSTSYYSMNALFELVSSRVNYPCFLQGTMSMAGLLDRFKNTPNAVLFGTASFWQGVDVPGDQLSCVIIDKLPFSVPTDPLVAARTRFIDENGGRSFFEYSVPNAIIALKQGVGRLIRSTSDRGVMVLLDPRLKTKGYGADFLKSLPGAPITSDINDVVRFFESETTEAARV